MRILTCGFRFNAHSIHSDRPATPERTISNQPEKIMKYIYTCNNKACAEKEGTIFQLEIPGEAVMDENNVAMLFCHRCRTGLIIKKSLK
jgi:hypothetical protein